MGALCVYKATLIRDGYGYTPDHEEEDSDLSLDENEEEDEDTDVQADARGTHLLSLDNTNLGRLVPSSVTLRKCQEV